MSVMPTSVPPDSSAPPAAAPTPLNLSVIPSADGSSFAISVTVDGNTYAGTLTLATPPAAVGSYLYSGATVAPLASS